MQTTRPEQFQTDAFRIPFSTNLPSVHDGVPVGNGIAGALVWAEANTVHVTFNRSDYWDHRGALVWNEGMNYNEVVDLLQSGQASEVIHRFRKTSSRDAPERPTRLPMGRIDYTLPEEVFVQSVALVLPEGKVEIVLADRKTAQTCTMQMSMKGKDAVVLVETRGDFEVGFGAVPSNPLSRSDAYASAAWRLDPPGIVQNDSSDVRWVQAVPDGAFLGVHIRTDRRSSAANRTHETSDGLVVLTQITCAYGENEGEALTAAGAGLSRTTDFTDLTEPTRAYWHRFWTRSAIVRTEHQTLDRQYLMGMYRLGASSVEGFDATGLQGPWIEDHRMPPWSGDFHLNVNIQECYWPAFAGNCMSAAKPLVDFVLRHEQAARNYARLFAGVEDGYHLPHAIDDTGACMGGFWTGSIDHGSTAWLIHTLMEYCRYEHRHELYRDLVAPLLCKVLRVSQALLRCDETGMYRFEVSVSPELGGAGEHAWGVNSSYQLAAIHACARDLRFVERLCDGEDRAALLKRIPDLDEVLAFASALDAGALPKYASAQRAGAEEAEILVFDEVPLPHSHRHHSHLAGIWPLQTLDTVGADAEATRRALSRWVRLGVGEWSGWSFPWASILHSHSGSPDAAFHMLQTFMAFFTNEGYATTHDATRPGLTVRDGRPDIMQLEAGLGFSAAVIELIVRTDASWWQAKDMHTLSGYHIADSIPAAIPDLSFSRVRLPGAVLADGIVRDCRLVELHLEAEHDCSLALSLGTGADAQEIRVSLSKGRSVRVV
ncbi:MAG: hypothetical protein EA383_12565 [Spirochaetaceae bacterium]|nr:MAG: hypothetical protein EA383_12565 [Spirochaetaceae bacterium]